jgi:predicted nicotinamide N-methyase
MSPLRLSYQTVEFGKIDIHLCTLRNTQEFYDPDGIAEQLGISSATWPIFGVLWPSSLVLAHHVCDYAIGDKRVLEIGCGMALSSLLLNKKLVNITATDYHPETQHFLDRNATLNGDRAIPYERADWAHKEDSLGQFDLIIGSDLLYEDNHIALLASFIDAHAMPDCEVIIVDPGRGRKNKLTKRMNELGFSSQQSKPPETSYLEQPFKGHILEYARSEKITSTVSL